MNDNIAFRACLSAENNKQTPGKESENSLAGVFFIPVGFGTLDMVFLFYLLQSVNVLRKAFATLEKL